MIEIDGNWSVITGGRGRKRRREDDTAASQTVEHWLRERGRRSTFDLATLYAFMYT